MSGTPPHQTPSTSTTTSPPRGRVVVNVTPQITTTNANTQQSESILALLVGIALGIAGALAAMERAKRDR